MSMAIVTLKKGEGRTLKAGGAWIDVYKRQYIFSGAKGTGKLTLADAFAMALQCTGEGERPCGSCHSCQQAASGNHPDIIHLTHEKPNSIGVEDVREQLVGDVQIRPYNGKYKICLLYTSHRGKDGKSTKKKKGNSVQTAIPPNAFSYFFINIP